jgi:sulfur-carrier protein
MKVRVRLFAGVRDAAGCDSVELELPAGATIAGLRRELAERFPSSAGITGRAMFALGTQYAADATEIPPGADVACIPPVSGG